MAASRESLSAQSKRRTNYLLLVFGIVLALLFLLAWCRMQPPKQTPVIQKTTKDFTVQSIDANTSDTQGLPSWTARGDAQLVVTPSEMVMSPNVVIGSEAEAPITLRAENAPILLESLNLAEKQEEGFVLSGACLDKGRLDKGEECVLKVSWKPTSLRNIQNTLTIVWREHNPRIYDKERTSVVLKAQSTDSKDCVICCEEKEKEKARPIDAVSINGEPIDPNDPNLEVTPEGVIKDKDGNLVGFTEPKKIPLNLHNDLMGSIADNGDVIDKEGKVVGRLLEDNTIINPSTFEIIGKAIYVMHAMNEHGHVFGRMIIDENSVSYVDAKGKVIGFPRVDGQVVDAQNRAIGYIAPWGGVIDSMGTYIGMILPTGSVVSSAGAEIATMRPMGFAVGKNGDLVGGVVPRGVGVGAAGRRLGKINLIGEVKDSFDQTVGHVLLDKSIVDAEMNEIGSSVRQGLVIDEANKIIGFVNSEGKVLNFKATQIGIMTPDGTAFANKKFVGTLMPEGQVTRGGCSQIGSVYPDGTVRDLSLKNVGRITPDGKAIDAKGNELGSIVPWGTAIAEGCRLLGLISLNGSVVSSDGVKNGCVNPDGTVQNLQGQISGEVTPLGLYVNAQNQVIGRVRLDGQIMDNKGAAIGCVYEKKLQILRNDTKGVIVDENGYPLGGSSIGNKAYDENGNWIGDVYFNGWVIGDKGQLKGVVPFSGTVFSDKGKIVGHYSQLTGMLKDVSGANLGRILPGLFAVNLTGTEILGKLIPEGTSFMGLDGRFLGKLNSKGVLVGVDDSNKDYLVYADGSVRDGQGRLVGGSVPEGPVISGSGKYVGIVNERGEIVDNRQIKVGRVLTNGLAISDKNQVFGKVFPAISIAVSNRGFEGSVEPKVSGISADVSYQLQVNDPKGSLVGMVSGTGIILGLDNSIAGRLVPIAPFVSSQGKLLGWTNFQGEVNAPDGRSFASILPSGIALDATQSIIGSVVTNDVVVDSMGAYLGHVTSRGGVLSSKGEEITFINGQSFLYNSDGIIVGQVLKPGIAIDANGQVFGWTRADGQIENAVAVLGSVGLDGHVFDKKGQIIGRYLPLGVTAFNDASKSVGFINEVGKIMEASGLVVTDTGYEPYVVSKSSIIGLEKTETPFVTSFESGKILGIVAENASVLPVGAERSVGSVMTNHFFNNTSNQLEGAMVPSGLAIMPTLGIIGSVSPDGQVYKGGKKMGVVTGTGLVYSTTGELIGGVFSPNVLINKKGEYAGATSGTPSVFKSGVQIGNKLAFNSALSTDNGWIGNVMPSGVVVDGMGQHYGVIMTAEGTVVGNDNVFAGRVLPDGSVVGVPEKAIFNTMPYAGHTVKQGIPIGLDKDLKVVGKTTIMGDVVDDSAKKLFRISDNDWVLGKSGSKQQAVAHIAPIISAVDVDGKVMGVTSANGTVVSYQGDVNGRIDNRNFIRLNDAQTKEDKLRIQGILIPEGLVVNNCKVVGQTAYDGRVINGQGSVVARIDRDQWAIDANGEKIGRVARNNYPCITKEMKYMGRSLPDSTVVDLNGVEIGCATNSGELLDFNGKALCKLVDRGPVFDDNGNQIGFVLPDGTIWDGTKKIGMVDWTGVAYNEKGERIGWVPQEKALFMDEQGRLEFAQGGDDVVHGKNGEALFIVPPKGQPTDPWGNPLPGLNPYVPGLGYLMGCDLIGGDGQKIASLMADGTFRDENGDLVYRVTPDGQVYEPNGNFVERFRGVDILSALKRCGMSGATTGSSGRKIETPNGSIITVDPNGSLVDENGVIIGYLGEDGRPYTLGNKLMTESGGTDREIPNINPPFQPTQAQKEDFIDKINKRRQGMKAQREGGGGTLKISAKIKAMAQPKKDKDWSKLGIQKSVSTWPVDMSHVILEGKAIPAVLARSIDSRYPNVPALAIVETNVYGEEGRNILIPAGSRLIGTFSGGDGEQQNGVSKLQIAWKRLIRPDGSAFNLEDALSGDAQGRGAVAAYLDEQLWNRYGTSVLSTLATSAVSYLMATNDDATSTGSSGGSDGGSSSGGSNRSQAMNDARKNFIDQIGSILEDMIERAKETPAVVFVPSGTRLTVFPKQDLWLRSPDDDVEYLKNNPPEEEDDSEYQAKTPQGVGSWTATRKNDRDENTAPSSEPTTTITPDENKAEVETPLYDGTENMPEDISNRKVEPVVPEDKPYF